MKHYLLPKDGTFFKVNMHCHTTVSDGTFTPEEIKALYLAHGYSAVAFTDHEVLLDHSDLCDENFVALHGYEMAIKARQHPYESTGAFMPVHHLIFLAKDQKNLTQPFFYEENMTPGNCHDYIPQMKYHDVIHDAEYSPDGINSLIDAVNSHGFLVTYNHPNWSLQTMETIAPLKNLHAIEVINTGCFYHGDMSGLVYGEMCRLGNAVVPVAGDDNHNPNGTAGSCFAYTMLKAPCLSYDALMEAYEKGDGYASCGPEFLDLYIEDNAIHVRTSPVRSIVLLSEGRTVRRQPVCALPFTETEPITEAVFPLEDKFGAFFRIELVDFDGRRAFSRAYSALPEDYPEETP